MSNHNLAVKLPSFQVIDSKGQSFSLDQLQGKKVVLFFYPKDMTPGCTIESNEFNDLHQKFVNKNAVVFGVSRDSTTSHCKFIDKYGFQFELISDTEEKLCRHFDVIKEKNMYGKKVMGIERSTFVFNEAGDLIFSERKVKAEGHALKVLTSL